MSAYHSSCTGDDLNGVHLTPEPVVELIVEPDADDAFQDLRRLHSVIDVSIQQLHLLIEQVEDVRRQRDRGRSYRQSVAAENGPSIVDLLDAVIINLGEASAHAVSAESNAHQSNSRQSEATSCGEPSPGAHHADHHPDHHAGH
ncbi:hypothetical protein [Kineococcus sp. SYSU DK003]|uniref:hypothetical protein n=1 Tax=Kineococcus sp. SYSU DK003 TaxID=3383124 RepID=UPI003D7D5F55